MTVRLMRRADVSSHDGTVRIVLDSFDGPAVVVLSAEAARDLAIDINDAAAVADIDNEERVTNRTEVTL